MEQKTNFVRMTANLPAEVAQALKEMAEKRGTNMTEVLRHAISLEKFASETIENGGKLLVEDADKNISRVLLR